MVVPVGLSPGMPSARGGNDGRLVEVALAADVRAAAIASSTWIALEADGIGVAPVVMQSIRCSTTKRWSGPAVR